MTTEERIQEIIKTYIPAFDPQTPAGHYEMDEDWYYNVQEYESKRRKDCLYESHKQYVDIQLIVEGEEYIYTADADTLQVCEPYSAEKDIMFYDGDAPGEAHLLRAGDYLVLYPQDAHQPMVCTDQPGRIKKVVYKVKIQ